MEFFPPKSLNPDSLNLKVGSGFSVDLSAALGWCTKILIDSLSLHTTVHVQYVHHRTYLLAGVRLPKAFDNVGDLKTLL